MRTKYFLIVTCEHAGNMVPVAFKYLFPQAADIVLVSHRGWDPGALKAAKTLANSMNAPLFFHLITRLLVEINRTSERSELFSEYSKGLKNSVKKYLLDRYYHPYRNSVMNLIDQKRAKHTILHLSIHSFTPVLFGTRRKTDIGILADVNRQKENEFALRLMQNLVQALPTYQIDLNEPYNGADDGFTTFLRNKYGEQYLGIELEFNQKHLPIESNHIFLKSLEAGLTQIISPNKKPGSLRLTGR